MTQIETLIPPAFKKKRKNKYIPHLAEFYFSPKFNWSNQEAFDLYTTSTRADLDIIYYTDCITGMQQMPPESVDLVIADPPFGIDFSGREALYNRDEQNVTEGYVEVQGDYGDFTRAWISELPRLMRRHATAYIFSGWTNLRHVLDAVHETGLCLINHLVWHYQFATFAKRKFSSSHYHILLVAKNDRKYFFHRIEHYNEDVWEIKRDYAQGEEKNGTKLPGELIQKCLDFSSKPGGIVLDPFMGNGTTAFTARANFRHYLGFELNQKVRPLIDKNLQKVTLGQSYKPYKDRLPTIEELAQKYPRAYQEFLKRQGNASHSSSKDI